MEFMLEAWRVPYGCVAHGFVFNSIRRKRFHDLISKVVFAGFDTTEKVVVAHEVVLRCEEDAISSCGRITDRRPRERAAEAYEQDLVV